jgi:hypothetical protein
MRLTLPVYPSSAIVLSASAAVTKAKLLLQLLCSLTPAGTTPCRSQSTDIIGRSLPNSQGSCFEQAKLACVKACCSARPLLLLLLLLLLPGS